jgi:hypothetical protein
MMRGEGGELRDLGDGLGVYFNPGGRFHGWLFRCVNRKWVSVRELPVIDPATGAPVQGREESDGIRSDIMDDGNSA